ncbi:hypothetical protein BaOVIS_014680 [Babesia ovis]|uniref:Uncharacterized protein n=1 Tax=Babesia ovis TaxID=5869 RepID=A0A9W5T9M1_BABOV|nr:hypothetical protein BaOVIS_014680 [Babesia ovis]
MLILSHVWIIAWTGVCHFIVGVAAAPLIQSQRSNGRPKLGFIAPSGPNISNGTPQVSIAPFHETSGVATTGNYGFFHCRHNVSICSVKPGRQRGNRPQSKKLKGVQKRAVVAQNKAKVRISRHNHKAAPFILSDVNETNSSTLDITDDAGYVMPVTVSGNSTPPASNKIDIKGGVTKKPQVQHGPKPADLSVGTAPLEQKTKIANEKRKSKTGSPKTLERSGGRHHQHGTKNPLTTDFKIPPSGTLSKRRLRKLEGLFSDEHSVKLPDIVSSFYDLLGSVNTEITHMYDLSRDPKPGTAVEGTSGILASSAHDDGTKDVSEIFDNSELSVANSEDNIPAIPTSYDGDIWSADAVEPEVVDTTPPSDNQIEPGDVQPTHLGITHLTNREIRKLRHMKMLASHEKVKLLRNMINRKNIHAVFFPAQYTQQGASGSDDTQPDVGDKSLLHKVKQLMSQTPPFAVDYRADSDAETDRPLLGSNASVSSPLEYGEPVSSLVICITKIPPKRSRRQRELLKQNAENIALLKTVHSDAQSGTEEDCTSSGNYIANPIQDEPLDMPVTMFSLQRGFLKKLYDEYLRPTLVSTLEKALDTKLKVPCGLMDFDTLDLDYITQPGNIKESLDHYAVRRHLRNVIVRPEMDSGEDVIEYKGEPTPLPRSIRQHVLQTIKWVKDQVFLERCIYIIFALLGRPPTVSELAYMLGHDDPEKLVHTMELSRYLMKRNFNTFAKPISEIILKKIESENRIDPYKPEDDIEMVDPNLYNTKLVSAEMLWERICSIQLETIASQGNKVVTELYGVACSTARNEYLKNKLPAHLPVGKVRLAGRGKLLYGKLLRQREYITTQVRLAAKRGVTLSADRFGDDKFARRIFEIEQKYPNAEEGTIEGAERVEQLKLAIEEELSTQLESTFDNVVDAIECARIKEYVGPKIKLFNKIMRKHKRHGRPFGNALMDYDDIVPPTFPEELPPEPLKPDSIEYRRKASFKKSLRILAVEALDDRVARFVFMAYFDLFINSSWDKEDLTNQFGLSSEDVVDMIFYAARTHCLVYEYWRIRLRLPPYDHNYNEFPADLLHKSGNTEKLKAYVEELDRLDEQTRYPRNPQMSIGTFRTSQIKPRMGTIQDSLEYYRKHYTLIERMLDSSPLSELEEKIIESS